jgi:hypothetical protein
MSAVHATDHNSEGAADRVLIEAKERFSPATGSACIRVPVSSYGGRLPDFSPEKRKLQPKSRRSESAHEIGNLDSQRVGNDLERLDGDITLTALDFADVRAIQTGTVAEQILGPATFQP